MVHFRNLHTCRINHTGNARCRQLFLLCRYLSQRSFPACAVFPGPSGHPLCSCPVGCTRVTSWHRRTGGKHWWQENTKTASSHQLWASIHRYSFTSQVQTSVPFSYASTLSSTISPFFSDHTGTIQGANKRWLPIQGQPKLHQEPPCIWKRLLKTGMERASFCL